MSCDCMGCQYEIMECYDWQKRGYDAGLEFNSHKKYGDHCFVFVLDKNGEFIIE